jgi:predicted permease
MRLDGDDDAVRIEQDAEAEIEFHLARKTVKLVATGMAETEARAEALRRFGDPERIKGQLTTMSRRRVIRRRGSEAFDRLLWDLRHGVRRLLRRPGATLVSLLTLTLGIGATTAIFSLVDGVLLRPLPFEEPEELVAVSQDRIPRTGAPNRYVNFINYWGLKQQSESLEAVAVWQNAEATLTGLDEGAEVLRGAYIASDMFPDVLRVQPALGRLFSPDEHVFRGVPVSTVLLSHGLWTRASGGDPDVVGREIELNLRPVTVVGVMPPDFRPPFAPEAEFWFPASWSPTASPCPTGGGCLRALGRLRDGFAIETAREEAEVIALRQEVETPEASAGYRWNIQPLRQDLVADRRLALLLLLGASGLVLLIACVNQASLLLADGVGRERELAVRFALGAGRSRIAKQLLVESSILALLAGGAGVLAAVALIRVLAALAPGDLPRIDEIGVDGRVLLFATGATLLSGLVFAIMPALRSARGALYDAIRATPAGKGRASPVALRRTLVAGQVAFALVLLTGAALLLRSFQNLRTLDVGFEPEGVLTFRVGIPFARYPETSDGMAFHDELEARLSSIPGVESVGATTSLPLAGFTQGWAFRIEGREVSEGVSQLMTTTNVTPGFFGTIGSAIVRGRGLARTDNASSPQVVVIDEQFAAQYFPGENPVGQRVRVWGASAPAPSFGGPWEIVGVVEDQTRTSLRGEPRPSMYFAQAQRDFGPPLYYVVRTTAEPSSLADDVRAALNAVDADVPAAQMQLLDDLVRGARAPERFVTFLLVLFAVLAVTLAIVGLYGVVSYHVNTRRREMGVRLALGASGRRVAGLVLRTNLVTVGVGIALGLAGSVGLMRLTESLLFGVEPNDPTTFLASTALLTCATVVGSLVPARRAAKVDVCEVLRDE